MFKVWCVRRYYFNLFSGIEVSLASLYQWVATCLMLEVSETVFYSQEYFSPNILLIFFNIVFHDMQFMQFQPLILLHTARIGSPREKSIVCAKVIIHSEIGLIFPREIQFKCAYDHFFFFYYLFIFALPTYIKCLQY